MNNNASGVPNPDNFLPQTFGLLPPPEFKNDFQLISQYFQLAVPRLYVFFAGMTKLLEEYLIAGVQQQNWNACIPINGTTNETTATSTHETQQTPNFQPPRQLTRDPSSLDFKGEPADTVGTNMGTGTNTDMQSMYTNTTSMRQAGILGLGVTASTRTGDTPKPQDIRTSVNCSKLTSHENESFIEETSIGDTKEDQDTISKLTMAVPEIPRSEALVKSKPKSEGEKKRFGGAKKGSFNPYSVYLKKRRDELKEEQHRLKLTNKDIMQRIAREWKETVSKDEARF